MSIYVYFGACACSSGYAFADAASFAVTDPSGPVPGSEPILYGPEVLIANSILCLCLLADALACAGLCLPHGHPVHGADDANPAVPV